MAAIGLEGAPPERFGPGLGRPRRGDAFGIGGFTQAMNAPTPTDTTQPDQPTTPTTPPTTPTAPKPDFGRLSGFDAAKLNDPNRHSFKYDVGRTLAQFDPRAGFSSDVINALNALGYGTFSGSGQNLSLTGATGSPDAADFSNQDWIYAYDANSPATRWQFGGGGAPDPYAAQDTAYGPSLFDAFPNPYQMFPYDIPSAQPAAPQQGGIDPATLQALMSLLAQLGPKPGYSATAAPSFSGAQTPRAASAQPDMTQILSQILGILGGRAA